MTSPCTRSHTTRNRTGAMAVVFGLALTPTLALVPAAYGQDSTPSTVRALIGGVADAVGHPRGVRAEPRLDELFLDAGIDPHGQDLRVGCQTLDS